VDGREAFVSVLLQPFPAQRGLRNALHVDE
jgi:hypothetical protein